MAITHRNSTSNASGFTLIELLVVIAIIGILAAVVLASLGSARQKGADAAVEAGLNEARSSGELYASNNNNSYSGVCSAAQTANGFGGVSGPGILAGVASSTSAAIVIGTGGTLQIGDATKITCNDAAAAWTVEAPLTGSTSGSPRMWCVDSTGVAGLRTSVNAGTTACP